MKKIKISGIKKAVGEYKNWKKRSWSYCASIMMDLSDGQVWTDCFIDCNSWKEYRSDSIICLTYDFFGSYDELTMQNLKEHAANKLKKHVA